MSDGKSWERRASALYERAGYEEYRPQESKWDETDVFGLFDVVVLGPGRPRFVQVKSGKSTDIAPHFEAVEERFPEAEAEFDYLVYYPGHGGPHPTPPRWRMFTASGAAGGGYREVVDEREDDTPASGEGVVSWILGPTPDEVVRA